MIAESGGIVKRFSKQGVGPRLVVVDRAVDVGLVGTDRAARVRQAVAGPGSIHMYRAMDRVIHAPLADAPAPELPAPAPDVPAPDVPAPEEPEPDDDALAIVPVTCTRLLT